MTGPNLKLKALIIENFGSQVSGARAFEMNEYRLSRIIHKRALPKPDEKRTIAWKLQKKICELFPEDERG